MGPIDCPETSVRSYHHTLRIIAQIAQKSAGPYPFYLFFSSKNYEQIKVVLNGCEPWVVTLKERHRLRVAGRKREEVSGSWRIYYDEKVYSLWC
jgi:hypothetical protein